MFYHLRIFYCITLEEIDEESNGTIEFLRPDDELSNDELMMKYGITYADEKYIYKNYKYDTFSNAINYARYDKNHKDESNQTTNENFTIIKSLIKPIKVIIGLVFLLSFITQLSNIANGFTAPWHFVAAFVQGGIAFLLLKSGLSGNKADSDAQM
jgi:hypothetical protein